MKCPECGQWNRASMPHCTRCGTPLNIDEASRIAWKETLRDGGASTAYLRADEFGQTDPTPDERDTLAREMQDLKVRKQRGSELQEKMRGSTPAHPDSSVVVKPKTDKSPAKTIVMQRVSESGAAAMRESEARHRVRFMDDSGQFIEPRTYDPLVPNYPRGSYDQSDLPVSGLPRRYTRDTGAIVRTVLLAVAALAFLAGVILLVLNASTLNIPFLSRILAQGSDTGESKAIVSAGIQNDLAAHTIMIPGEDGTTIYIKELHASYMVDNGFATIVVPDHTWYDNLEGSLDDTMDVTLTPFLKSSSGRQVPMDPVTYTITIPLSPITLDTPDSMRMTVSTTMYTIKIIVLPGSRVTVNGNDYSDTVSSITGEMSYNATVQPIGDNDFNIVVRSQYCRDNAIKVVLYRAPQEIPLDLAVGTYGTTDRNVMKVTATTLPGAYVTVTTPHSDLDITDLDTTGKFTFNALFDKIGDNTISITSSYPGKKPSTVDHTVYYLPPADEYTVKAWPLDAANYSELLSNIAVRAARCQVYVVKGVVQYSVSDKPQMVVINTSEDGKSQPVLVKNYTKTKWEVGQYYRLYADAYSTYNSMPSLNARYTYLK